MNIIYPSYAYLFILLLIIITPFAEAQEKYPVANIPKSLLLNSKAVIRNSETIFEISDVDKAIMKVKYAITILNTNGLDNSIFIEFYNKYLTLRKIDWSLYDQAGKKIRNNTSVELEDYAAMAGYSVYEDNRVKVLDPKFRTTPFTVEYTFEEEFNGLFYYPDWTVYQDFNISVENSKFTIITPKGFKFRYLESNLTDSCLITESDNKTTYTWNIKSQPAIKEEPFGYPLEEFTPVVFTAPNDFEIGGFSGNSESWSNLSKWIDKLGQERDKLSPETNMKIKTLIAGLDSDYEKIKIIYSYLQNKVRYVNISEKNGWLATD